jgi:hypothetical protein
MRLDGIFPACLPRLRRRRFTGVVESVEVVHVEGVPIPKLEPHQVRVDGMQILGSRCIRPIADRGGLLVAIREVRRREVVCFNAAGALATREQSDHAGCLHTGSELEQGAAQSKVVRMMVSDGQKVEETYPQTEQKAVFRLRCATVFRTARCRRFAREWPG